VVIRSQPTVGEVERGRGPDRLYEAASRYDPAALGRIFDGSFASVHGVLSALLREPEVVEHAAVATYRRVLDRLQDARTRQTGLEGWLTRMACLEAARHRASRVELEAPAGIGARPYDPRRVRGALWALPSDQREVVGTRVLAGFDAAHVAAAGGRGLQLVQNLQQRALRSLAQDTRRSFGRASELALDRGLDRIAAGASAEEAVAAAPELRDQQPLLEAAWAARTLLPKAIDPGLRDRVRSALLAEAAERRATWVHAHQGIGPIAAPPRRRLRTAGRLATGTLLAIVAVGLGILIAGFAVTSEPDSPMYPLRRVAEDALVFAHRSAPSRAELEVDLADQRLREADAMALNGKAALAVQAVHDRYVELRQAARALIDDSGAHDAGWQAARAKLVGDETANLNQLEEQLTADGDGWAAQQVRQEAAAYDADRKNIDQELGVNPQTVQTPATPAPPGSQSTAIP
jgi:DNA-directed RNA polymerase specialized sigma24 family protein